MNRLRLGHAVIFSSCLFVASVEANGINPPRPVGSETVVVSCVDRASGGITILQRAQISDGNSSRSLEVQLGNDAPRTVQLSQLRRLQFHSGKPRPDGFVNATLELAEPVFVGKAIVKVRTGNKPVLISGFSTASERAALSLGSCKELEFKKAPPSEPEHRDAMKN